MQHPKPSRRSDADLAHRFQSLAPAEKFLLQLLSVIHAPVSNSVLLTCAKMCRQGTNSPDFTGSLLAQALENLRKARLIISSGSTVRCHPHVAHAATMSAIADAVFPQLCTVVQRQIPMVSDWGRAYYRSYAHCLRDVRIGCYLSDAEYTLEKLSHCAKDYLSELEERHPLLEICDDPFDAEWVETLPPAIAAVALKEILAKAVVTLAPSEAPFAVLGTMAHRADLPPDLAGTYCKELTLRGRGDEARQLAQGSDYSVHLSVLGWDALNRGAVDEALAHFQSALQRLKRETGKRKAFLDDLAGVLYVIALMGQGDAKLLREASEICSAIAAKRSWRHQGVYQILEYVIRVKQGAKGVGDHVESWARYLSAAPLYAFFSCLALFWCGSKEAHAAAQKLLAMTDSVRQAGYLWLADEMELTADLCGVKSAHAEAIDDRYRSEGRKALARVLERNESWENALKALIRLKGEEKPPESSGKSRLVWHLEEWDGSLTVTPREQKLSVAGKWSSGRDISLKKLAEQKEELPFLSEQDLKVCVCIRAERESGYGYYRYGRESYQLDQDSAIPLLIGHPHLFLDRAATVPVELVQGEPELQVSARDGGFLMTLYPAFEPDQKLVVIRDTPTRFKVFQGKEEYRRIAAIVGEGLAVPARGKEQALKAIASLSSVLTVHSDLADEGVEVIPADATPCFHLLPYSGGIKLELMVRPFTDTGPCFYPGGGGETVFAEVAGKRVQARRDLRKESRNAAEALTALSALGDEEEESLQWLVPDPERALEVLAQLKELGDRVRVAWPEGAKFRLRQQAGTRQLRLTIRQAKEWFELDGELILDQGLTLDLQKLLGMMQEAGASRFLPLGDGEYLALSSELRKRLEEISAYGEAHGKGLRIHPLAAAAVEEFAAEAGGFLADQAWQEQVKRLRAAQEHQPELPSTLQAELRVYQEEGFRWLNRLAHWGVGACLADDMGLGKTVQALAQLLTMAPKGPSLVVAPTSVCHNWESEAARFAPTLNVVVFGLGNRQETLKRLRPFDLVIVSYGLLQQEAELLAEVGWQGVVLDEAQAIKNTATKRSQAAMQLKGAFKMVATGTPIENHLGELWNVFRFINPGLLGSLKQFNVKFASPIEKTGDKKARARLKKLIHPFVLRRTKNQVLEELPSRTEIVIKVDMGKEEASLYEALRREAVQTIAGIGREVGKGEQHLKILAELMRLRRACCNPRLILPETKIPSSKLAVFGEILEELKENRHKALVFSQFVSHLALIREYLDAKGVSYQYLDGSTPVRERKERVEAFQGGAGELFLISLKAGGVGLNLTAADFVIHMDPWWNPAVEDQASDRAHRIGQTRPVTIYRLVTKGTIEEKIVGLHLQKRTLAESLLEESDLSGKVSAAELLELLRSEE